MSFMESGEGYYGPMPRPDPFPVDAAKQDCLNYRLALHVMLGRLYPDVRLDDIVAQLVGDRDHRPVFVAQFRNLSAIRLPLYSLASAAQVTMWQTSRPVDPEVMRMLGSRWGINAGETRSL